MIWTTTIVRCCPPRGRAALPRRHRHRLRRNRIGCAVEGAVPSTRSTRRYCCPWTPISRPRFRRRARDRSTTPHCWLWRTRRTSRGLLKGHFHVADCCCCCCRCSCSNYRLAGAAMMIVIQKRSLPRVVVHRHIGDSLSDFRSTKKTRTSSLCFSSAGAAIPSEDRVPHASSLGGGLPSSALGSMHSRRATWSANLAPGSRKVAPEKGVRSVGGCSSINLSSFF